MSGERKEEFRWLEAMISSMEKMYGENYYAFYMRKDDIDKLRQLYGQLIQKPEIEDMKKYVEEKATEAYNVAHNSEEYVYGLRNLITQIISDVRGGKK